jgi:HD-like signal output (HDOD) protein
MVNDVGLTDAEKALLGCTHAEIGAYLLGIWGLPHPIVEAVVYHHRPADCLEAGFSPLTAVHVADAVAFARQEQAPGYPVPRTDMAYLQKIGLDARLAGWEKACADIDVKGEH